MTRRTSPRRACLVRHVALSPEKDPVELDDEKFRAPAALTVPQMDIRVGRGRRVGAPERMEAAAACSARRAAAAAAACAAAASAASARGQRPRRKRRAAAAAPPPAARLRHPAPPPAQAPPHRCGGGGGDSRLIRPGWNPRRGWRRPRLCSESIHVFSLHYGTYHHIQCGLSRLGRAGGHATDKRQGRALRRVVRLRRFLLFLVLFLVLLVLFSTSFMMAGL